MKTLPARRVLPLRAVPDARSQKKVHLHPGIDTRRWKALKAYWDLRKSQGMELSLLRVGLKKGLKNENMATQILYGHERMNEIWMLCFAHELKVTPQKIWGADWPFPDLTPGDEELIRLWQGLSEAEQAAILTIVYPRTRRR